jgi:hypothetical protein
MTTLHPNSSLVHEILSEVSALRTKKEKIQLLQQMNSLHLRNILRGAFDETIQWDLPEGTPPVTINDQTPRSVHKISDQLKYFVTGGPGAKLMTAKKQRMFISFLEQLHSKDVAVIIAMKDKKMTELFPGLKRDVVNEAFPGLLRG